jgi:competence protein ComEC
LAEVRRAIADRFEAASGPRAAALARGMLLGDRAGIEPETRESFRNAGTLHILSISGLHVCIIAGFLAAGARAAKLGATAAMAAELSGLALYVLFVGAPAPALRSALLWTLSRGARLLGRGMNPLAGWGAAGLVLHLVAPAATLDLGFALSFGAVLGLHAGGAVAPLLAADGGASRWRRACGVLLASIAASAGASLGTLSVEAMAFGSIPVMGPIANLAVIPLTTIFLAESIVVAVAAWILPAPVVDMLGGALDVLAAILTTVNEALGGRVEPFAFHAVPSVAAAALSGMALLAAASLGINRAPTGARGRRAAAGLFLVVAALAPLAPHRGRPGEGGAEGRPPTLVLLDVGQGDGAILLGAQRSAILVDAGPRTDRRDEGQQTIEPALRAEGIRRVVAAISSHGHRDHEGGLVWLARRRWIADVVENGGGSADRAGWRSAVTAAGGRTRRPGAAGLHVLADAWSVRVGATRAASPGPPGTARSASANAVENDRSLVAVARAASAADVLGAAPAWTVLFPGDLERDGEEAWLATPFVTTADVLKVPHHGSGTSSTPSWVARVRPRVAAISVGARNRYGHPVSTTLSRYRRAGALVVRTDREGAIRVTAWRGRLWISTRAHPAPRVVPERGRTAITPCFDFP